MRIITDDISFSRHLLNLPDELSLVDDSNELTISSELVKSIFYDNRVYSGKVDGISGWNTICVVNHAQKSHLNVIRDQLAKNIDIPDMFILVARKGENFIGHKNRQWIADDGNLHMTIFIKPKAEIPQFATAFTIMAVVSIIQTLDQVPELENKAAIRWVNDILVDDKKIGGVLCRTQMQGKIVENASIGLGLNINAMPDVKPDIFVPFVTHVAAYSQVSIKHIFGKLLQFLYVNYQLLQNGKYDDLWQVYYNRSAILNEKIAVYSDPDSGSLKLLAEGMVERIGQNLEIYLYGTSKPIISGRIVLLNKQSILR
jgi:biotin-[acetyl-CoA-carboxylase] ligase BirA-like protein